MKEACGFRDIYSDYQSRNIAVQARQHRRGKISRQVCS
ncbi:hypothetical protein QUB42_24670 [Microcoleus sp. Aus8_D1]